MGYLIAILLIILGRVIWRSGDGKGEAGVVPGIIGLIMTIVGVIVLIVSIVISLI